MFVTHKVYPFRQGCWLKQDKLLLLLKSSSAYSATICCQIHFKTEAKNMSVSKRLRRSCLSKSFKTGFELGLGFGVCLVKFSRFQLKTAEFWKTSLMMWRRVWFLSLVSGCLSVCTVAANTQPVITGTLLCRWDKWNSSSPHAALVNKPKKNNKLLKRVRVRVIDRYWDENWWSFGNFAKAYIMFLRY